VTSVPIGFPATPPRRWVSGATAEFALFGLLVGSIGFSALTVLLFGPWALVIPLYAGLFGLIVVAPEKGAMVVFALAVAFEPAALDITKPLSAALYQMPPGMTKPFGLTMTPVEMLTALTAISLLVKPQLYASSKPRLPALIYALPAVIVLGFLYGARKGGALNTGYEEARGLLFGMCAFYIARRLAGRPAQPWLKAFFAGTVVLAIVVILRYYTVTRAGSAVPIEFQYAHEDAVFLAIGCVLAGVKLMRSKTNGSRVWLLLYGLLLFAALFATGRRAGTLVLVVGVLVAAWLTFRHRPRLVIAIGLPVLVVSTAYLGAYWNKQYGTLAQPARAIRSQFDPNARDESSDTYRTTEAFDVVQTIRGNRLFGVGFGVPFAQYQPLPSLTSFWPLQSYTPHENVLWLWLKGGILGISVALGIWVLAFKRCLIAIRQRAGSDTWLLPVVLASVLTMYLSYAGVDQSLTVSRASSLLAVALALAFSLPAAGRLEDA
jgi:hypothetical protein